VTDTPSAQGTAELDGWDDGAFGDEITEWPGDDSTTGEASKYPESIVPPPANAGTGIPDPKSDTGSNNTGSAVDESVRPSGVPAPGIRFFHPDYTGNISYVTDSAGTIRARMLYQPYGECIVAGDDQFRGKFNSHESDKSGLMYFNARYYDPEIGRFAQADPTVPDPGKSQLFNRYMFVAGNPISFVDMEGYAPAAGTPSQIAITIASRAAMQTRAEEYTSREYSNNIEVCKTDGLVNAKVGDDIITSKEAIVPVVRTQKHESKDMGLTITSPYGKRNYKNGSHFHKGIDARTPGGDDVISPADGVVSNIGNDEESLAGLFVTIDHGNGVKSVSDHLSKVDVTIGQKVKRGQPIGKSGDTGIGPAGDRYDAHLHFGITIFGIKINPLTFNWTKMSTDDPNNPNSISNGPSSGGNPDANSDGDNN